MDKKGDENMASQKGTKMTSQEHHELVWGWLFVLPTMIGLIILNFVPIIQTIWQSFCKTGAFGKGNIFIGLCFVEKKSYQSMPEAKMERVMT